MATTPQTLVDAFVASTTGTASHSKTVTLSDGNVLVAYVTELGGVAGTDDGFRIRGQVIDPDGNKVGDEDAFRFPNAIETKDFDVVALDGNQVAIIADQDNILTDKDAPVVKLFSVSSFGNISSDGPIDARVGGAVSHYGATITGHGDNGFVTHAVDQSFGIRAIHEEVNLDGHDGIGFIGGDDDGKLDSAQLKNGNVVLLIDEDGDETDTGQLFFHVYREDGTAVRLDGRIGAANVANFSATVKALAGGGFVIAFTDSDGDQDIRFIICDENGNSQTNLKFAGIDANRFDNNNNEPAIAALEDGGFILFYDKDNGVPQIRGQRYDAAGEKVGADFVVANENGAQISATTLEDGRVAVSYTLVGAEVIKTEILTLQTVEIVGTEGSETLAGTLADDEILGLGGDDTLFGDRGDDVLYGGDGNDTLFGGAGADVLFGDAGDDFLFGGAGADELRGAGGNDEIAGDAGNDLLIGAGGNDRLDGGAGDDDLRGGNGNDVLISTAGDDVLSGGGGADTFVFNLAVDVSELTAGGGIGGIRASRITVTDFETDRAGEKIDLSAVAGIDDFADLAANHLSQQGEDVVIEGGGAQGSVLLEGVQLADLAASDFLF